MLRFAQDNLTPRLPRLRNFKAWMRFLELEPYFLSNIYARQTPGGDVMWTVGNPDAHGEYLFEAEVEMYGEHADDEGTGIQFDDIPTILQFFEVGTEGQFMVMVNFRLMNLFKNLSIRLGDELAEIVKKVQQANAAA